VANSERRNQPVAPKWRQHTKLRNPRPRVFELVTFLRPACLLKLSGYRRREATLWTSR
jgi:hypothetical protein